MFAKNNSNRRNKILILLFVALILITILNVSQKESKNFIYTISSPFQSSLWNGRIKIFNFLKSFIKIGEIGEKERILREENQKLTSEIVSLKEIKEENEDLRKALGLGIQKKLKLSFVQIIGKNIIQDTILINKGSDDGISKNMPVITPQKVIIGKISKVYKNFSEVELVSNKKISFDAEIQGVKDSFGVGKGNGNLNIIVNLVPRKKRISKGNLVISSGLGNIFPKGLLIGKVKKIEKKDTEAFQKITVEPAFNIKEISNLFVIIGRK